MKVNGKYEPLKTPMTLLTYLEMKGYDMHRIAVERNGEIMAQSMYNAILLAEDDVLEVVRFVGGG